MSSRSFLYSVFMFVATVTVSTLAVDMNTAIVFTLNDGSKSNSLLTIIYGNPNDYVWRADSTNLPSRLLTNTLYDGFHAVAVDTQTTRVYYGDNARGTVSYNLLNYNNGSQLINWSFFAPPITKRINGIAYDWSSRNVYWADGEFNLICATTTVAVRSFWKPVVTTGLNSPQDVVVDPTHAYLFWSDGTQSNAKIERSDLSGRNRTVLRSATQGLIAPTTLVVDFSSQKLYWLDSAAQKIGRINFDGSDPDTWTHSNFRITTSITVYQNYIFCGTNQGPRVYIYNVTNFDHHQVLSHRSTSGSIVDMTTYSRENQPQVDSACLNNNGGCSHFCWTTETSRTCGCAIGFFLSQDGQTCYTRPFSNSSINYLLVADYRQQNVYQLHLATEELRSLFTDGSYIVALALDPSHRIAYLAYVEGFYSQQYRIRKRSFDGNINSVIYYASSGSSVSSLAVDSSGTRLYLTDQVSGTIGMLTTDGFAGTPQLLVSGANEKPKAIAVDSTNTQLYWSDCSQPTTIQTASATDGSDRRVLINDTQHSCITALAIDVNNQKMYWGSTGNFPSIEMAFLNGSGRTTLYTESTAQYSGITLLNNSLYISDSSRRYIVKFDLMTRLKTTQLPAAFANVTDICGSVDAGAVQSSTASTTLTESATSIASTSKVTSSTPKNADTGSSIGVIVGVGAGVVIFVVIVVVVVVVVVVCVMRRTAGKPSQKVESQSETPYAVYRSGTYERTRRPVDSMYPESEDGHYATIDEPNYDYTELQFQQPQPQRPGIAPVPPPSYQRGRRDNLSDRSYLDLRSTTSEVPVPESRVPPPRDN